MPSPTDRSNADFRSDTVTLPSEEMYDAIRTAELGDDVFGDDPTVNALEAEAAELLGQEAALYVPSGTMGNSIALAVATRPGDEILLMPDSHVYLFEQGGSARLWGVHARTIPGTAGCLDPRDLSGAIRGDDPHFPRTSAVLIENTHNMQGGLAVSADRIDTVAAKAHEHGLHVHLDGARLMNAAVAWNVPVSELTRSVDSVMMCLSKGLRAPAGSIYASTAFRVAEARRVRKLLGGGMRQAGILAACGRVALNRGPSVLAEDHRRAAQLAAELSQISGLRVSPEDDRSAGVAATNIVMVGLPGEDENRYQAAAERLAAQGVLLVNILNEKLRLVTHAGVDDDSVARAIAAFRTLMH